MSGFTRFGCDLWNWEPFVGLPDADSKLLWIALYTSAVSKRLVPGLWQGGIHTMAEAARQSSDVTIKALDTLLDHEMVEFDTKTKVLRMTASEGTTPLPDTGEFPFNGNAVRGWWNKFVTVTSCAVRDAHVATLRWLMDAGAHQTKARRLSADHEAAWSETFKQVSIPASRRRGVRRLMDDDTSTAVQPSLFGSPSQKALPNTSGMVPVPLALPSGQVLEGSDRFSMITDTLKPFPNIQDQDQVQDHKFFSSPDPEPDSAAPARSPTLRLVPLTPEPYVADEVIGLISEGSVGNIPPTLTQARRLALQRAIVALVAIRAGGEDFKLVGAFLRANPHAAPMWMAVLDRGDLAELVLEARTWQERHGIGTTQASAPQEAGTM